MLLCLLPDSDFAPTRSHGLNADFKPFTRYAEVAACGFSGHMRLEQELEALTLDCSQENWDGHDSPPVSIEAHAAALRLIRSLPHGTPDPSLGVDSEGCVTFEWYVNPRKTLLVSVHPDYRIDYATLRGGSKAYGTEPFFDALPSSILQSIQRLCEI